MVARDLEFIVNSIISMAAVTKPKPKKDLSKWLTREQVCDLARVNYFTVLGWEKRGLLHPERSHQHGKTTRAVAVYDPVELANLPQYKRHTATHASPIEPGERTARAFEFFARGKTIRHVVIELRITVAEAEALLEQYRDVGKATAPDDEDAGDGEPGESGETMPLTE